MRILLFEYFTGGWCREVPPVHLYREGEAMLHALAVDLNRRPDIKLSVLRDMRLPLPEFEAEVIGVDQRKNHLEALKEQLAVNDAFWPIAPETEGILAKLCELAEQSGCGLLNASSKAVGIAGDKLKTITMLRKAGVACIETLPFSLPLALPYPVVVKPNDGVGCGGQYIVRSEAQLPTDRVRSGNYIVQPYLQGLSGSLSLICAGDTVQVLAVNRQNIEQRNNTFMLNGCDVGVGSCPSESAAVEFKSYDWLQLAEAVNQAIPGLFAYVGIDFIISDQAVIVLEVNPRLTTSYVGLAQLAELNPAALVTCLFECRTDRGHAMGAVGAGV